MYEQILYLDALINIIDSPGMIPKGQLNVSVNIPK